MFHFIGDLKSQGLIPSKWSKKQLNQQVKNSEPSTSSDGKAEDMNLEDDQIQLSLSEVGPLSEGNDTLPLPLDSLDPNDDPFSQILDTNSCVPPQTDIDSHCIESISQSDEDLWEFRADCARAIHMGSLVTPIIYFFKMDPKDIDHRECHNMFMAFLGYVLLFASPDKVAKWQQFAPRIVKALGSRCKVNEDLVREFDEAAHDVLRDGRCQESMILGYLLLNGMHPLVDNNPRGHVNSMWIILGLNVKPVYQCEALFLVLKDWCKLYRVHLDDQLLKLVQILKLGF